MTTVAAKTQITLKNILYLTDFSTPSEVALPFATGLARSYGSKLHILHVLTPVIPEGCNEAIAADIELANTEMERVKAQLGSIDHDATNVTGMELWPAVEQATGNQNVDLIVLGTHGRTHARKLLMGSVAEEIFRRSSVPVLTVGPDVPRPLIDAGRFGSILFAADFSKPCEAASPLAVSLAERCKARLSLLYVAPESDAKDRQSPQFEQRLHNLVSPVPRTQCQLSTIVKYGEPADRILETAADCKADLIVLGVRRAETHLGAATHLERPIAHRVVAHAKCPVLTVRG